MMQKIDNIKKNGDKYSASTLRTKETKLLKKQWFHSVFTNLKQHCWKNNSFLMCFWNLEATFTKKLWVPLVFSNLEAKLLKKYWNLYLCHRWYDSKLLILWLTMFWSIRLFKIYEPEFTGYWKWWYIWKINWKLIKTRICRVSEFSLFENLSDGKAI